MQLRLSITSVFFMITATLCKPGYQQPFSGNVHQNETETEITTDEIVSVELDVDNTTETRNETLEELQRSMLNPQSEYSTYPPQHENESEPESRGPIETEKPPSRPLTAADLYAMKSFGERVAAWTPESGVNPDELGSDIVFPPLGGELIPEDMPRETSNYKVENVMEITPDMILLVGKKIRPGEPVTYPGHSYYGVRAHEQSGVSTAGQMITVDKLYTQPSEYRINTGMPHYIRPVASHVQPYLGMSLPPVYQGYHENRYQTLFPYRMAGNWNVKTWAPRSSLNPDEEMYNIRQ